MKIIENGQKMEGIPYPVAVWDAKTTCGMIQSRN